MAISMNSLNNKMMNGFAANQAMRNAVVKALYSKSYVIRKFKFSKDELGNMNLSFVYGTIGQNPVAEAFGLDYDVRINNLPVQVKDMNDNVKAQKINVDGIKYIFCSSLITIECDDDAKINNMAADGFVFGDDVYRVAGASPSNEKHSVKFYYRVTDEIDTEVKAFNIMDNVAGCVFSAKFATLLSGKDITKMNTRLGNYLTTMLSLTQIDLKTDYIALVDGSIAGADDFDEETKKQM